MPQTIDVAYLDNWVVGATLLGTGGGGNPKVGYLMSKQAIEQYGSVELLSIDELPESAVAGSISMMGAPSVSMEKIPNGQEFQVVIDTYQRYENTKLDAIFPIEAGGINSLIPLVAAATLRLPMLDGDAMGRAFPQLDMVTPTLHDVTYSPVVLTHEKLDPVIITAKKPRDLETYARHLTLSFGGSAIMAELFLPKVVVKKFLIRDVVTKSHDIGAILRHSETPIADLQARHGAHHLFDGKIIDLQRFYEGGFNKGTVFVQSFDGQNNYQIDLQNENLIARRDDEVLAVVPDLIAMLDYQTKLPLTTETLKFGQRITVIALPADEQWRTKAGIELVGPQAFGYDFPYTPVEVLAQQRQEKNGGRP